MILSLQAPMSRRRVRMNERLGGVPIGVAHYKEGIGVKNQEIYTPMRRLARIS